MAEFKTVVKNYKRMCDSYKVCEGCPLTKYESTCARFMIEYPEKAEHIIMQWAVENPIKTNGNKFEEIFGYPFWAVSCGATSAISQWLKSEYKEPEERKKGEQE